MAKEPTGKITYLVVKTIPGKKGWFVIKRGGF
jgi:hypothetical protein